MRENEMMAVNLLPLIDKKIEQSKKEVTKICRECEFQDKKDLTCMLPPSELTDQICLLRHICVMVNCIYQAVQKPEPTIEPEEPEIPPSI
jgi:hypothetical protein